MSEFTGLPQPPEENSHPKVEEQLQLPKGLNVTLVCGVVLILAGSYWAIAESTEGVLRLHQEYRVKTLAWRVPFSNALSWGVVFSILAAAGLSAFSIWSLISGRANAATGRKLVFLAICSACVVLTNEVIGWEIWSHSEIEGKLKRGPYFAHFGQHEMFLLYAGVAMLTMHILIARGRIRFGSIATPRFLLKQRKISSMPRDEVAASEDHRDVSKDVRHPALRFFLYVLATVVIFVLILISKVSGLDGFINKGLSHYPRQVHAVAYGILFLSYVLILRAVWRFITRAGRGY